MIGCSTKKGARYVGNTALDRGRKHRLRVDMGGQRHPDEEATFRRCPGRTRGHVLGQGFDQGVSFRSIEATDELLLLLDDAAHQTAQHDALIEPAATEVRDLLRDLDLYQEVRVPGDEGGAQAGRPNLRERRKIDERVHATNRKGPHPACAGREQIRL